MTRQRGGYMAGQMAEPVQDAPGRTPTTRADIRRMLASASALEATCRVCGHVIRAAVGGGAPPFAILRPNHQLDGSHRPDVIAPMGRG